MTESEWEQVRGHLESSGLSVDEIYRAVAKYQARESFNAGCDESPAPRQPPLPGVGCPL